MRIGEELTRIGRDTGPRETAFGLRVLAGAQLELGAADALNATINQLAHVGVEQRWLPAQVYAAQWRATQAMLEGRFDDARTWGEELRRFARAYRGAAGYGALQAFQLARELGWSRPAPPTTRIARDEVQNLYPWANVVLAQFDAGDAGSARENLEILVASTRRSLRAREWSGRRARDAHRGRGHARHDRARAGAVRPPSAVRRAAACGRDGLGVPRLRRSLPRDAVHDARTMGRGRSPLRSRRLRRRNTCEAARSFPEPATGKRSTSVPAGGPATTARRRSCSTASSRIRLASACSSSRTKPAPFALPVKPVSSALVIPRRRCRWRRS